MSVGSPLPSAEEGAETSTFPNPGLNFMGTNMSSRSPWMRNHGTKKIGAPGIFHQNDQNVFDNFQKNWFFVIIQTILLIEK